MNDRVDIGTKRRLEVTSFLPPPVLMGRSERTRPEDPSAEVPRISLELSRRCNLRCSYCYSNATSAPRVGLTDDEVRAVIAEAVDLGTSVVSIVGGGESLLRRSILIDGDSCIDYANSLGCYCYVYTNCTLVDDRAARWLARRDVTVVGKLNSLRDDVQDGLAGVAGSSRKIRRGIEALLAVGLADPAAPRLGLETVICRRNYDELPDMWRWMRQRAIIPEVEIPTMHGRALDNREALYFDEEEAPEKYRVLFEEILALDRAEFGFDWVPHPPFVAGACRLHGNNCYINDRGGVQPCAGVDQEYGVLRVGARKAAGRPFADIVQSEAFAALCRVDENLTGACKACELSGSCYGCRAAAWNKTGDVFAEDPVCWRKPNCAPLAKCCPPAANEAVG